MDSTRIIRHGGTSDGRWRFTARTVMEFWTTESETALGSAFQLWLAARLTRRGKSIDPFRGDLPASFRDLTPAPREAAFLAADESTFHVDVSAPSPADFVVTSTDLPPVPIGSIEDRLLQRVLIEDLLMCRGFQCPFYHQIDHDGGGQVLCYTRLMLPVVDRRRDVSRIHAFCRPLAKETAGFAAEVVVRMT